MTAKSAFELAMKILGVMSILWGLMHLMSLVYYVLGALPAGYTLRHYLLASVGHFVVGVYLLCGAPGLSWIAYPDDK